MSLQKETSPGNYKSNKNSYNPEIMICYMYLNNIMPLTAVVPIIVKTLSMIFRSCLKFVCYSIYLVA